VFNKIFVVPKVGGANVDKSHEVIRSMKNALAELGYEGADLKIIESAQDIDENTVAVPIGGDGTVLYTAKLLADAGIDIPIIGFNLGQVGFLTDMQPTYTEIRKLYATILAASDDRFVEDQRTLLTVTDEQGHEYTALNDFVVSNLYSDNIIKYDLTIGESYAGNHKANGVIVSTPTGSTAYAMNVGGSIIEPDLDVLEIVPIAGMGMSIRPIIVGGNNAITVEIKGAPGRIVSFKADGRECDRFENQDVKITIKRHEKKVRLWHYEGWNFFDRIREKLNWNV
jgi:NAD+ kinase